MSIRTPCALALLALLGLSACGDGGGWVDFPFAQCPSADWTEMQKDKEVMSFAAGGQCSAVGKAYSGKSRCGKQGIGQIQCK